MMNFKNLLLDAKRGDNISVLQIADMYKPLLLKESIINGSFDYDLYQELCLTLLNCINKIKV